MKDDEIRNVSGEAEYRFVHKALVIKTLEARERLSID